MKYICHICCTGFSSWEQCAAKMNQMFHTQRLVEILLIGHYPFVMFIFLLPHMVNILVCFGDFNKYFEHKLIASRNLRVSLKQQKKMKKIPTPAAVEYWCTTVQNILPALTCSSFFLKEHYTPKSKIHVSPLTGSAINLNQWFPVGPTTGCRFLFSH